MRLTRLAKRAAAALACAATACQPAFNYLDPDGPRYAGVASAPPPPVTGAVTLVTFNLRYGEDVDGALAELRDADLLDADLYALQEMDAAGTSRFAAALGAAHVYYPASIHGARDFGNAVVSRWPILDDRKVLLPGAAPFDGRRRVAVVTRVAGPTGPLFVASVHHETVLAGGGHQMEQTLALLRHLDGPSAPGVVAGDFNVASAGMLAWTEARFREEGFERVAPRAGATTAAGPLGDLALDHVFARGFVATDARVVPSRGASDHRAVAVTLRPAEDP